MPIRYVIAAVILSLTFGGLGMLVYKNASLEEVLSRPGVRSVNDAADDLDGFSLLAEGPIVPNVQMLDEQGNPNTLERFRGKVVLLNLWASGARRALRKCPILMPCNSISQGAISSLCRWPVAARGEKSPRLFCVNVI